MNYADAKKLGYALSLDHEGEAVNLVSDPSGYGDPCLRFDLRAANQNDRRSELADYQTSDYWGMAWRVEFDMLLPFTYQTDIDRDVFHQWHATPDEEDETEDVPFLFGALDDKLRIVTSSIPEREGGSKGTQELLWEGEIVRGVWEHWHFELAFHWTKTCEYPSYLQACRNEVQVVDYIGAIGFNDEVGPYAKWGVYHWTRPDAVRTDKTVYFRNIVKERI